VPEQPKPLHIVNKTPSAGDALDSCLRHMTAGSALLLIEDGVYVALAAGSWASRMTAATDRHAVYAMGPDLAARGLADRPLVPGITVVDYGGFVDLVTAHSTAHSWF
jgi:tRNA 2-thiouridine synthesizing protein B